VHFGSDGGQILMVIPGAGAGLTVAWVDGVENKTTNKNRNIRASQGCGLVVRSKNKVQGKQNNIDG
jgi:hypothetical protein